MRVFIIKANEAHTDFDFSLKDLPGTSGRIDLICRALNAAFHLSHSFRKNVRVYVTFLGPPDPPKTIRFEGPKIRPKILNPDEISIAKVIGKALKVGRNIRNPTKEVEVLPGIFINRMTFEDVVRRNVKMNLYLLEEGGKDISNLVFPKDNLAFILGDHLGLTKEDLSFLEGIAEKISIGPKAYLTSHVISFVNIYLDRVGIP
ncbi:tRNA (pseudouridine(54)-N(1))-methyltransferase TrmY [Pyrococcus kukulkanii]|uniref:tRNA (pseudouridine(54)-N(1))-methyltransferase TrmY n=1 Tax=Pyrococcus kukulkanii TaxID=1609559 RepID=UPI003561AE7C